MGMNIESSDKTIDNWRGKDLLMNREKYKGYIIDAERICWLKKKYKGY